MKKYIAIVALGLGLCQGAAAADVSAVRTLGTAGKNTVYVFTSPACPHCATYHAEILPVLKKELADTGMAQIKLVDVPGDKRSLAASALGRCLDDAQYETYMRAVYDNQADWAYGEADYQALLKGYATAAGLDSATADKCLNDEKLRETVWEQRTQMAGKYKISGLPSTVVVQGIKRKMFVGADDRQIPEIKKLFKLQ